VGYVFHRHQGEGGGLVYIKGPDACRTHYIHLVGRDSAQWRNYIRFREALRADADLRGAYRGLKQELARRYPDDRLSYLEGKGDFIAGVLGSGSDFVSIQKQIAPDRVRQGVTVEGVRRLDAEVWFRFDSENVSAASADLQRLREVAERAGFELRGAKVTPATLGESKAGWSEKVGDSTSYVPLDSEPNDAKAVMRKIGRDVRHR
jgi:hypothetical protein